jgi:hypothetical protein
MRRRHAPRCGEFYGARTLYDILRDRRQRPKKTPTGLGRLHAVRGGA